VLGDDYHELVSNLNKLADVGLKRVIFRRGRGDHIAGSPSELCAQCLCQI
jgi:hypothetical protein